MSGAKQQNNKWIRKNLPWGNDVLNDLEDFSRIVFRLKNQIQNEDQQITYDIAYLAYKKMLNLATKMREYAAGEARKERQQKDKNE